MTGREAVLVARDAALLLLLFGCFWLTLWVIAGEVAA